MKAAVYVQFFHFSGRLLYKTGFYTRQASIQDRLMGSSCAIISSIHSAEHACRESTLCVLYMISHTMHTIKCHNNKPRLLFKSGFYSRAASMQGRLLNETSHYLFIYFDFQVTFIQLTAQLLLLLFCVAGLSKKMRTHASKSLYASEPYRTGMS